MIIVHHQGSLSLRTADECLCSVFPLLGIAATMKNPYNYDFTFFNKIKNTIREAANDCSAYFFMNDRV